MKRRKLKKTVRKAGKAKSASRKSSLRKAANAERSLDAFMDASAEALGLPIEKSWRPSIRANLVVTFRHASHVMDFPLPDDAEPAPVYRA